MISDDGSEAGLAMLVQSSHTATTDNESFNHKSRPRKMWRKGKWTEEEETYTMKLIEAFIAGVLNLPQGTTLRSFLSDKLSCDPMRITKKFAGSNGIGKQVFSPCLASDRSNEVRRVLFAELEELERTFSNKLENSQNVSFPISAKALAFSAKLQMQVQQGPVISMPIKSVHGAAPHRTAAPPSTSLPWNSRFDASNTNSISRTNAMDMPKGLVGEKRSNDGSDSGGRKKQVTSDLDASSLLLNFFKATREDKDSSDIDSDSNESSNSHSGDSGNSTSISQPYKDGGHTTGSGSGSGSDEQYEDRKNHLKSSSSSSSLLPF